MTTKIDRLGSKTLAAAVALTLALSACSSSSKSSSSHSGATAGGTSAASGPLKLTIALPSTEIEDTPLRAGLAALASQGISVAVKEYESVTQAQQAFVANKADLLFGATESMLSANAQGADARAVWIGTGDNWVLIGKNSITDPKQLDGKPLASGPSGQTTYTLMIEGAKKLGFTPKVVTISGSNNRAQAMVQGQVRSAVVSATDYVNLNSAKPGQYRIIASYAQVFPGITDGYIWMHQSFITKHQSQTQTIVNALAKAYKRVNTDEAWFVQQGKIYTPTTSQAVAQAVWQTYTKQNLWPADGNLTVSECQGNLDFLTKYGYVKTPSPVATWCLSSIAEKAAQSA